MILASIINECEDLLICDLAETYGIYDYKSLKPSFLATLAIGLPESSRVVRFYSKTRLTIDQMLMALIVDGINIGNWQRAGGKKSKKPQSFFEKLTKPEKKKDELMSFRTAEDFEAWRNAKMEKYNG